MFKYEKGNKRYYTLDNYYKQKYNSKVFKVSLNLGLSCPNIDGTKGYGGCIYCKNGSKTSYSDKNKPLQIQFEDVKKILHKKWPKDKYIAYFGNDTNTYGNLEYLKKSFEEVLTYKNVVGINIATRCDAISPECLEYLKELNKKTDLVIELGLQTIHKQTSKIINRGHTLEEFETMYKKLKENNIKVVIIPEIKNPIIAGDVIRLTKVIQTLLFNSLNSAFKNSIMKIYLKEDNKNISVKFESRSGYINPEKMRKRFQFHTCHNEKYDKIGTGIGLYLVNKIIEKHHGKIIAESSINQKNILGFEIPIEASDQFYYENCV